MGVAEALQHSYNDFSYTHMFTTPRVTAATSTRAYGTPSVTKIIGVFVYVIAWFGVLFGINSTSNAEIIVRGAAEYNLLHYECY